MNNSLKMNRRERKPIFKLDPYQEAGREDALKFADCTEEDRRILAEQLAQRISDQRRKERIALLIALGTVAVLVALLLIFW